MLPIGLCTQIACIWETSARNPGNAHRFRDFQDVSYIDFLTSAAAIAPILERAPHQRVGQTVLEGVQATREVARGNPNLGIVLLLAPLAAVPEGIDFRAGLCRVLDDLNVADARAVYQAIRLAAPAGLGRVAEQDIADEPTLTLRQVMALAADRDLIARQYADGFREVFEEGVPALRDAFTRWQTLEDVLVAGHLHLMARHPDSLIARKCGLNEAQEAMRRAQEVLRQGWPGPAGRAAFTDLDAWLLTGGRGRNPGTISDLLTACLFVLLREGAVPLPPSLPW
jgi:triphosphoribosyl-dephospho-CoA synthase